MITAHQLRAARALLNTDQRQMAELAGLSVPTIQRMEASYYAANPSLKKCALRPIPQLATGQRRAVRSAWKRYGTVGHIGS